MSESRPLEAELVHHFKNYLSIILGFCNLLLAEMPAGDPKRGDVLEIQKAAEGAMTLMPELERRID